MTTRDTNAGCAKTRLLVPSLAIVAVVALTMTFGGSATAAPIFPGDNLVAVGEPEPTGGAIVAGPLVSNITALTFSGSLTTTVINDPTNPLGGLTFIYQLVNNAGSQHAIQRLTVNGYGGFLTDVSYQTPVAGVAPTLNDRSVAGDVMGFRFLEPDVIFPFAHGFVDPGLTSAVMVVQTNALDYKTTIAAVQNGSNDEVPSYAPDFPIPEPGTLVLAGLAAVGLALGRWFRAR